MLRLARRIVASRWYIAFIFGCWAFGPEARRFIDWQSSFHSLSIIAIMPLASVLGGLIFMKSEWPAVGPQYRAIVTLWALAFGYAFLVTLLTGALLPALYDGALFGVPVLVGFVLMARRTENLEVDYDAIASIVLWTAVGASVYGIVQYVSPPPWDVYWANNARILSLGEVVPFGFRVFGTLNSPGILADYIVFALLVNLPRLKLSNWKLSVLITPCVIALLLTEVRALWVTFAAGVLVYILFAPRRRDLVVSLAATTAVVCVLATVLITTVGGGGERALTTITERLQTFGALDSDSSAMSRGSETTQAIRQGFEEPIGQGLGVLGTAQKLSDQGGDVESIDSGYFSRFIEMGVVGFVLYLMALAAAAFMTYRTFRLYALAENRSGASLMAASLGIQAALLVAEVFADHHEGLPALFFWLSLYFSSAYAAPSGIRREQLAKVPALSSPLRVGWSS